MLKGTWIPAIRAPDGTGKLSNLNPARRLHRSTIRSASSSTVLATFIKRPAFSLLLRKAGRRLVIDRPPGFPVRAGRARQRPLPQRRPRCRGDAVEGRQLRSTRILAKRNNLAARYLQTGRVPQAETEIKAAEKAGFRVNPQLKEDVKKALARR